MATQSERARLLAIRCPWCGAGPGRLCAPNYVPISRRDRRPSVRTLEAGCHDARWQEAIGRSGAVRASAMDRA